MHSWLSRNRLSLNPSKTEFLIVGSKCQREKLNLNSFTFCGSDVPCVSSVKNLGVTFEPDLSFDKHISLVCKSSYFNIRQIRQFSSVLDRNSSILLANSLVSSRLDFCNSLYYNLPKRAVKRLQLVQNSLARAVVPSVKKFDHISSVLNELHWLPVEKRIIFQIATLTYITVLHYSSTSQIPILLV